MKYGVVIFIFFSYLALASSIRIPDDQDVLKQFNSTSSGVFALDPNEIDILVWNIYKSQNESWPADFNNLSRGKELVLLQEAVTHDRMVEDIVRMPWMEFILATSWYDMKEDNSETGVMTGSLVKPEVVMWQRSYYLEPFIGTPKMVLFTKYRLQNTNKTLLVANIHGINFVRAHKLKHMLLQAKKYIETHDGPVVFAGDFNTWSNAKLQYMNTILSDLNLKAVAFENDIRTSVKGHVLDHIWTRGLRILSSDVPNVNGSDHKPMIVRAQVN